MLLRGATSESARLAALLSPHLDRAFDTVSPIERSLLLIGGYELLTQEVPYRVVLNEAIELAKLYAGTDGDKFVNGVLDKLARDLRPAEFGQPLAPRSRARSAAPRSE